MKSVDTKTVPVTIETPRTGRRYLPLGIDMSGLPCLVVGGGRVGTRKTMTLVGAEARVTVLAPEIGPRLHRAVAGGEIIWEKKKYSPEYLSGHMLIVAATPYPELNLRIARDADSHGILCCAVSPGRFSRVLFPAVCSHGGLTVAVHSDGRDCTASCRARDKIAAFLRKEEPVPVRLSQIEACPQREVEPKQQVRTGTGFGKVYFVGAGPGAPDLITLRGCRLLHQAEIIVADDLLPRSFLRDLRITVEHKEVVWLNSGERRRSQAEINKLIREAAQCGKMVVRLKAGDPFVFGRGGEEAELLSEKRIPWEVVPGMSSCTAGPALAGLPLTRRGTARSFAVVSARCAGGGVNDSYPKADSLVIMMAVAVIREVVDQLLADGWAPETPTAVIERATLPWERRVETSLSQIVHAVDKARISSPALLLVGAAAARSGHFQRRPRILFTGLDPANFRTLGDLIHWPALQVARNEEGYRALPSVIRELKRESYGLVVFTGRIAVDSFLNALEKYELDSRVLSGILIAAMGAGTVARLAERGLHADAISTRPGVEKNADFLEMVTSRGGWTNQALLVQGSHIPTWLPDVLGQKWLCHRLALHRLIPHPELGRTLPGHDVVYFVSPSGVRAYWETYGEQALRKELWCIGKETKAALSKLAKNGKVIHPCDYFNTFQIERGARR